MSEQSDGRATYTYAVARPFHPGHLSGVRGVDGAEVHLVRHDDLVGIASTLSFSAADESAMRARLEDPGELEAIARAHHDVVGAVFEHSAATLPFRLATIHQSEQRLVQTLRAERQRFTDALERLVDRVEIGVKLYAEAVPTEVADSGPRGRGAPVRRDAGRGREYLQRRRDHLRRREQTGRRIAAAAADIGGTLAERAVDHRFHRPQDPRLSGVADENVLNAAYLVDRAAVESFVGFAASLGGGEPAGARIEITGPWPPYSFAEADGLGDMIDPVDR